MTDIKEIKAEILTRSDGAKPSQSLEYMFDFALQEHFNDASERTLFAVTQVANMYRQAPLQPEQVKAIIDRHAS